MLSARRLISISSPLPPRFSFAFLDLAAFAAFAALPRLLGLRIVTSFRTCVDLAGRVTILKALVALMCILAVPPQRAVASIESLADSDACAIGRKLAIDYQLNCTTFSLVDPGINWSRG